MWEVVVHLQVGLGASPRPSLLPSIVGRVYLLVPPAPPLQQYVVPVDLPLDPLFLVARALHVRALQFLQSAAMPPTMLTVLPVEALDLPQRRDVCYLHLFKFSKFIRMCLEIQFNDY